MPQCSKEKTRNVEVTPKWTALFLASNKKSVNAATTTFTDFSFDSKNLGTQFLYGHEYKFYVIR